MTTTAITPVRSLAQMDPKELFLFQEVYEVVELKRIRKQIILGLSVGMRSKDVTVEVGELNYVGFNVNGAHKADLRCCYLEFNHAKAALLAHLQADLAHIERLEQSA